MIKPTLDTHKIISLAKRPEKLEHFFKGVPNIPATTRVIEAVEGSSLPAPKGWEDKTGALGCFASHVNALREAVFEDLPYVVVFEDDAMPTEFYRKKGEDLLSQLEHLEWDLIHLGQVSAQARAEGIPVLGTGWLNVSAGLCNSHAYVMSRRLINRVLQRYAPGATGPVYGPPYHFDRALASICREENFGLFYPKNAMFVQNKKLPQDVEDR